MPIYEYRCDECGSKNEHLQKMAEPQIAHCPACGSANYHKLLSAAGFQLKGSGWYATDFKGSSTASSSPPPSDSGHTCSGTCSHS